MSLYGLDLIVRHGREPIIIEINGVASGMKGFQQVYGDTRVEDRVYGMLRERHGEIHIASEQYLAARQRRRMQEIRDAHPIRSRLWEFQDAVLKSVGYQWKHPLTFARNGHMQWLVETPANGLESPFPPYTGDAATVFNVVNDTFPKSVNPHVAQAVTDNKFFQYRLLRESDLAPHVIPSALVGLDITDHDQLEQFIRAHRHVVLKPIRGICGYGVRKLHRDKAKALNAVHDRITYDIPKRHKTPAPLPHVGDYLAVSDFSFEYAVGIVQPFIDSRRGNGMHTAIRAIVCNGEFVDAYARQSSHFRANLTQGAIARHFPTDPSFRDFCERTVAVLEERCASYPPETFRHLLWRAYLTELDDRGHGKWQMSGTRELLFVFNALRQLAGEKIDGDGEI